MLNHIKDLLRTGKEEIFWVQILHARTVLDTLQQKKDFHKMTYKQIGTTTKKWPLHHDTQKRLHYPPWKHSTVTNTHTYICTHNYALDFDIRGILSFRSFFLTLRFSLKIKSIFKQNMFSSSDILHNFLKSYF